MYNYMLICGGALYNIVRNYSINFNTNPVNSLTEDYIGFRIVRYK